MKSIKLLLVPAMLLLPVLLFAQAGSDFTINGKVSPGSKVVKVFFYDGGATDSAEVVNGGFRYKGQADYPKTVLIFPDKIGKDFHTAASNVSPILFFEDPGATIDVTVPDSVALTVVKGGKTNTELEEYKKFTASVETELVSSFAAYKKASGDERAEIGKKREALFNERSLLALQFAKKHEDSFESVNEMLFVVKFNASIERLADVEKIYDAFSADIKASKSGKDFKKLLDATEGSTIGGTATDFTIPDTTGREVSLHDFRGKYVLVDFWASWCGPCRAENPNVVKAYNTYKDKQFTVVGVSLDKKTARDKWVKAINDDKLNYNQLWDAGGIIAGKYSIHAIPQNFLLDPQGKIIAKNLRGEALQTKLAALLGAKK